MPKIWLLLPFSAFILVISTLPVSGAVASHKHDKYDSKERLKDGIFRPQDAQHYENSQHNVQFDHEAIIGNVKEAQEYDTLSPEESKKRLLLLLHLMDTNKDKFVDRHELKAWILRSFRKLSEEEAADRFEELDENVDAHITWQEFLQDVYAMEDDEQNKEQINELDLDDEEMKVMKSDKEMFTAADLNKDGVLSLDEFYLFQSPEEHPQMLPVILQQVMHDKDSNGDGKVDFQEYVTESAENHDKSWLLVEKERFDKDFDTNKDGFLTGNEVLNWIIPSSETTAHDEMEHLFESTDDDQDNRLSFEEILQNYETFVGSEATNYGDHLKNIKHLADEL